MTSSCRWSGNWKRLWRASVNLRSGWPGSNVLPRRRTIPLCRRRKGKSPIVPPATSRRARAAPGSGGRCTRTRIVWSTPGLSACPKCQAAFPETSQTPQQIYERIELPPIKPDVTQVRLFGGRCACCGERVTAAAPAGLEPGSPFGQSIAALVVYLHYAHAIGMERLARLMDEIFSLTLSEGAISNMLARAREPLLVAAATIRATVLASPVVCSDETSARVSGKNWWEWVFIGTLAVLHVIRPSRGKAVVQALFGEIRPMVWVSDMLGSQRGHAVEWQVCLAHLLRDATYAIECGDTAFSAAFKRLLLRAIAIGRRRDDAEGHHAEAVSRRPGSPAQPHHGSCSAWRTGTQAAQAHRRQPGAPVRVHHQSGRALYQQRL